MEDEKYKRSNDDKIEYIDKEINKELEKKYEVGEDGTKYGEFISSYFAWISLPNQKERAEELDEMTKCSDKERERKVEKQENK